MKKALFVATALLIAAPAIGVAQDDHHQDRGPPPSQSHPSAPAGATGAPGSGYRTSGGAPTMGGFHTNGSANAQGRAAPSGARGQGSGGYPQASNPAYRSPGGGYPVGAERFARPTGQAYAGGPGARGGGQPFGYGGRQYFRYRAPPYRYPVGYYSWNNHTWRRGEWLPPVFTSAAYYIDDWYDFGLWEPAYGFEWVRVGADAVLINLADGQIADVVPGIYY